MGEVTKILDLKAEEGFAKFVTNVRERKWKRKLKSGKEAETVRYFIEFKSDIVNALNLRKGTKVIVTVQVVDDE